MSNREMSNKIHRMAAPDQEGIRRRFKAEFLPDLSMSREERNTLALETSAFHLREINKKFARFLSLMEEQIGGGPRFSE